MAIRRKYWLTTLLFVALLSNFIKAQNGLDFASVDSVSYRLYLEKDWSGLEAYSKLAMKGGYDYYYLRIRTGIALFEQQKYRAAIGHFEKALSFSANDPLANEYLYYAYLYAGNYDKARWLSKSFDAGFASYMKTKKLSPIEFISAEGGMKISDTSSRFKTAVYTELACKHYIGRRMSLFHAVTYYQQQEFRFSVKQFQYYVNAMLPLKHGWAISAGLHALYYEAAVNTYSTETTYQQSQHGPVPVVTVSTVVVNKSAVPYLGSASVLKQTSRFDLWLGTTVASLDTVVQLQLNAGACYYPFRNNRLALGGTVYMHTTDLANTKFSVAVAPFISAMLSKRLWACLGYFSNNGVNVIEQNGYLVNNSLDFTTERYTASLSYALSKKMYIYGVCGRENKKEIIRTFKYNYNVFILGIKLVPS